MFRSDTYLDHWGDRSTSTVAVTEEEEGVLSDFQILVLLGALHDLVVRNLDYGNARHQSERPSVRRFIRIRRILVRELPVRCLIRQRGITISQYVQSWQGSF